MGIKDVAFPLRVDFKKSILLNEPVVTQNDNIIFVVDVLDDDQPFDLSDISTFTLVSERPRDAPVMTVGKKTGENEITFDFGSNEVAQIGTVNATIQLYGVDGRVSAFPFTYKVRKDPVKDYIPSENEETLIEIVLGQGPAILSAAELATQEALDAAEVARNAQGPVGPQGLKGEAGERGPVGPKGETGATGPRGEIGPTGPKGEKGNDGKGVAILGSFADESLLPLTGNPGDAYLVDGVDLANNSIKNLYVWSASTATWENVGNIQGPQGIPGVQGERGEPGPRGEKGEPGESTIVPDASTTEKGKVMLSDDINDISFNKATTARVMNWSHNTLNNAKLNKTGGVITGALQVETLLGADLDEGIGGAIRSLEVKQNNQLGDALMMFHVANNHAVYLGLDGNIKDLVVGGYSTGATTKHRIIHTGNARTPEGDLPFIGGHMNAGYSKFYKDMFNHVHVFFEVKKDNSTEFAWGNTQIATLPVGFRPRGTVAVLCTTYTGIISYATGYVMPGGELMVSTTNGNATGIRGYATYLQFN